VGGARDKQEHRMSELKSGRVTSIAINDHKLSFALDRKDSQRFVLYNEAANTQTIPQFELATRSWMLAVLQTAFTSGKEMVVKYEDNRDHDDLPVLQIELHDPLHIEQTPSQPIQIPTGTPSTPIKGKAK
jgi:hypothetical protein